MAILRQADVVVFVVGKTVLAACVHGEGDTASQFGDCGRLLFRGRPPVQAAGLFGIPRSGWRGRERRRLTNLPPRGGPVPFL